MFIQILFCLFYVSFYSRKYGRKEVICICVHKYLVFATWHLIALTVLGGLIFILHPQSDCVILLANLNFIASFVKDVIRGTLHNLRIHLNLYLLTGGIKAVTFMPQGLCGLLFFGCCIKHFSLTRAKALYIPGRGLACQIN